MYLEAEQYVSDYDPESNALLEAIKSNAPFGLGDFAPTHVKFELAYWRKANAIHNWFVQNVQDGKDDCNDFYVPVAKLRDLKDLCEKVLANIELAPELLPAKQGFFFGSYEYDEWYEQDLRNTVEKLNKILSHPDSKKWWISYRSSW